MERQGRAELANALMNEGNALQALGQLAEAVVAYDRAIAIGRELVEQQGCVELANDLAIALMTKGVALDRLDQSAEAVEAYDRAIAIYRVLEERQSRVDLANALINKLLVLEKREEWDTAISCYDEAISVLEGCITHGMCHLLGNLLQMIRYRLMTVLDLGRWEMAAQDVGRFLHYSLPHLQEDSLPESVLQEYGAFIGRLGKLSKEDRAMLLNMLADRELITFVESFFEDESGCGGQ